MAASVKAASMQKVNAEVVSRPGSTLLGLQNSIKQSLKGNRGASFSGESGACSVLE
ncbi:hypothetical protein ACOSQ4_027281 [Xanthoceras sorbifolium]